MFKAILFETSAGKSLHRKFFPGLAMLIASLALLACDHATVDRKYNASGNLVEEQAWLEIRNPDGKVIEKVPHGLHVFWDDRGRRTRLEVFNRGKRVGYVLNWDASGNLYRNGEVVTASKAYAGNIP